MALSPFVPEVWVAPFSPFALLRARSLGGPICANLRAAISKSRGSSGSGGIRAVALSRPATYDLLSGMVKFSWRTTHGLTERGMGIKYRVEPVKGYSVTQWIGTVTADEFLSHVRLMTGDPSWPTPRHP